jgi:hypothetical protein
MVESTTEHDHDAPPYDPRQAGYKPRYVRRREKRLRGRVVKVLSPAERAFEAHQAAEQQHDQAQDRFRRERRARLRSVVQPVEGVWLVDQLDIAGAARADYAVLHQRPHGADHSEIGAVLHHRMVAHLHRLLAGLPDDAVAEDTLRMAAERARYDRQMALATEGLAALAQIDPRQVRAALLSAKGYGLRRIAAELGLGYHDARDTVRAGYSFLYGYVAGRSASETD